MKKICKECGKEFELSESEIQFFKSKNLNIPKRCKACRDKNKQNRQRERRLETQPVSRNYKVQNANRQSNSLLRTIVTAMMVIVIAVGAFFVTQSGQRTTPTNNNYSDSVSTGVSFRNERLLNEHYRKHGVEMGFSSASEYEAAARSVVENTASLHKTEAEDGDDVYYLKSSNEFVIVSTDGYIRTYFKPNDGIDYYNRQ